jgi:hypothetical protein
MAIRIVEQYPGKTAGANTNYPHGEARNVTTSGDSTGTPWERAIVNDDQGFKQALLEAAGITPSGNPDTAVASQYLQALQALFTGKISATLSANGSVSIPVMVGTTPRVLILKWGTFTTTNNNVVGTPQYVPVTGIPNAIFYVGLSEDGGATSGFESAQMDWARTTKTNIAMYSNYNGTCKYFLVGW